MKHFFRRVTIGLPIEFFVLALMFGSEFIVLTLLCTVGFSLIIYLPVAYYIGFGIESLVGGIKEKNEIKDESEKIDSSIKALSRYIFEARQKGLSDETIKKTLVEHGWDDERIAMAYANVDKNIN